MRRMETNAVARGSLLAIDSLFDRDAGYMYLKHEAKMESLILST